MAERPALAVVDREDELGNALYDAALRGDLHSRLGVGALIARGANVNYRHGFSGMTPLTRAAAAGKANSVRWLMKNGANPMPNVGDGHSALHQACRHGNLNVCRALLEEAFKQAKGDEIVHDMLTYGTRHSELTPLHIMAELLVLQSDGEERIECMNVLIDAAQRCSATLSKTRGRPFDEFYLSIVEAESAGNVTPLMVAAKHGALQLATTLIRAGANVKTRTKSGTALHAAAAAAKLDMIKFLVVEGGASLEAVDCHGCTPLLAAAKSWEGRASGSFGPMICDEIPGAVMLLSRLGASGVAADRKGAWAGECLRRVLGSGAAPFEKELCFPTRHVRVLWIRTTAPESLSGGRPCATSIRIIQILPKHLLADVLRMM